MTFNDSCGKKQPFPFKVSFAAPPSKGSTCFSFGLLGKRAEV